MDEQRSQVRVTALAHSTQRYLAAGGVLARYEPEPRSHLPAVAEVPRLAQGGNQSRSGNRPDAGDLLEPAACLALRVAGGYLRFELGGLLIRRLQGPQQPIGEHAEGALRAGRRLLPG